MTALEGWEFLAAWFTCIAVFLWACAYDPHKNSRQTVCRSRRLAVTKRLAEPRRGRLGETKK